MTTSYDHASLAGRELAVAMTAQLDGGLRAHFRHPGRQEDLTFAIWKPSSGSRRFTAVLHTLLLPSDHERILDGNVSFTADYLSVYLGRSPPAAVSLCCTPIWVLAGKT